MSTNSPTTPRFRLRLAGFFLLPLIIWAALSIQFQTRDRGGLDYQLFHALWIAILGGWLAALVMMRFSSSGEVDPYTKWKWTTILSATFAMILGVVLLAADESEVFQLYSISRSAVASELLSHLLFSALFFIALLFLSLLFGAVATATLQGIVADALKIASRGEEKER